MNTINTNNRLPKLSFANEKFIVYLLWFYHLKKVSIHTFARHNVTQNKFILQLVIARQQIQVKKNFLFEGKSSDKNLWIFPKNCLICFVCFFLQKLLILIWPQSVLFRMISHPFFFFHKYLPIDKNDCIYSKIYIFDFESRKILKYKISKVLQFDELLTKYLLEGFVNIH